jgi:hypothetical protein
VPRLLSDRQQRPKVESASGRNGLLEQGPELVDPDANVVETTFVGVDRAIPLRNDALELF